MNCAKRWSIGPASATDWTDGFDHAPELLKAMHDLAAHAKVKELAAHLLVRSEQLQGEMVEPTFLDRDNRAGDCLEVSPRVAGSMEGLEVIAGKRLRLEILQSRMLAHCGQHLETMDG
jgi:hypothetical protein